MKSILLFVIVAVLVSCGTTPVKDYCASGSWYEMGLSDGMLGEPAEIATSRIQSCAALGAKENIDQYTKGYVEGIKSYCSYKGGKKAGEKGAMYKPGTCPMELSKDFIKGYQEGFDLFQANNTMKGSKQGHHMVND